MVYSFVVGGLWVAWAIYWFAAAAGAKANSRRESQWSRFSHGVPLSLAVLLIAWPARHAPAWAAWLTGSFIPPSWAGYWIGVALLALGLGFSVWARRRLGRNWSGTVTVKQDHELVRAGPYRYVRHPIYTGILLGFVGSAIALGQWRGVIAVALCLYAFLRKISLEERWMDETFPGKYAAYRKEVKALIPFIL